MGTFYENFVDIAINEIINDNEGSSNTYYFMNKLTHKNKKPIYTRHEFILKYCNNCGSQRCEGIGTDWFNGCEHRHELDTTTEEVNNNDKV